LKMARDKLITLIISGVIIAGAGGYAYADQIAHRTSAASSAVVSGVVSIDTSTAAESLPQSQASSASETEASSVEDSAPKTDKKVQSSKANLNSESNSSEVEHMKRNVLYYCIVNPDTGRYVQPTEPEYFPLRKQLGGDAGTVPPSQSTACQAALKAFKAKQASSKSRY